MGLQVVNLMQRWKMQLCLLRFGEGHEQNKTTTNKVQRALAEGGGVPDTLKWTKVT